MQAKHLIVAALVGLVILLGFNMINSSRHEKARAAMTESAASEAAARTDSTATSANDNNDDSIASKPLGEQPKAILDDATQKIDQVQAVEAKRLEQMDNDVQ